MKSVTLEFRFETGPVASLCKEDTLAKTRRGTRHRGGTWQGLHKHDPLARKGSNRPFEGLAEAMAAQQWRQGLIWRIENHAPTRELRRRAATGSTDNNFVKDLTAQQWEAILVRFGNACVYCGCKTDITIDHVIPPSRGGGHTADNVVLACASCNSAKGTRTLQEWLGQNLELAV